MSGQLRRLADGLRTPAKGGVHPQARLRWIAPLSLMPTEAARRSECLPAREADRTAPSQPNPERSSAAAFPPSPESLPFEPHSPEPHSPEPPELSVHESESGSPSPTFRVPAAAPSVKAAAAEKLRPQMTARSTLPSVASPPTPPNDPARAPAATQREAGESVERIVLAALPPSAASAGKPTAEPRRATPPGEAAELGEADALEYRPLLAGEASPPPPTSPLAASAPGSRPKAARAAPPRDESEIHVHIGRIEVSALPSPPARISPRPAAMSLDEYLSRRSGEKR